MGGIYIQCGSFEGEDKSGSAIEGVLQDIAHTARDSQRIAITRIADQLNAGADHALIEPDVARQLAPLIDRYCSKIAADIAPVTDPFVQIERDHEADPNLDPTEAKYGKGLGWRYYCALDLARAFAASANEDEPVILTWD